MREGFDELWLFSGKDYMVNSHIRVHHPTLGEICEYGEREYFSLVSLLTATPADLKVQLTDMGVDYETIGEFELFTLLYQGLDSGKTKILFGRFDFSRLKKMYQLATKEVVLYDSVTKCTYDKVLHELIGSFIRKIHGLKKNTERAGNAITKQMMLEEARRSLEKAANGPDASFLAPLLSALTNSPEFKYGYRDVWDMPIYVFMDAVKRVQKMRNYHFLMSGAYSGNVDMKKVPKRELDWAGTY